VEPLGRDVDVDAALAVGYRQPRLRPEERLVLDAELVVAVDGDVAGRLGVAVLDHDRADDVRPRVVAVAVTHRRPLRVEGQLLARALGVDDRFERLIVDLDLLGCAAGLLRMLRGHDRDRLPEVPDAVHREHRLVWELEPVALGARHVFLREHRMNARHRQRGTHLDGAEASVRVRAAQRVTPEHPRCMEVTRVRELAGRLRDRVVAPDALADPTDLELADG
jgi:hypothetical protein